MDAGVVVRALQAALVAQNGAGGTFEGAVIERDEFVNDDPDQARVAWLGIYRRSVRYEPLTLASGYAGRYDASPIKLFVVLQVTDYDSGAACADRMETHIRNLITLLLGNDSLSGTIERIMSVEIEYAYDPKSDKDRGVYMQSAYITLELEVANE